LKSYFRKITVRSASGVSTGDKKVGFIEGKKGRFFSSKTGFIKQENVRGWGLKSSHNTTVKYATTMKAMECQVFRV
jgi:hypothetical protein